MLNHRTIGNSRKTEEIPGYDLAGGCKAEKLSRMCTSQRCSNRAPVAEQCTYWRHDLTRFPKAGVVVEGSEVGLVDCFEILAEKVLLISVDMVPFLICIILSPCRYEWDVASAGAR